MIDIKELRENPDRYRLAVQHKNAKVNVDEILALDEQVRKARQELQELVTEKNQAGKAVAQTKDPAARHAVIERMAQLKQREKQLGDSLAELDPKLNDMLLYMPLPAHPQAPIGPNETGNVEVRRWGQVRSFDFQPKNHVELGEALGVIDLERGVKLAGTRNYILKGDGALLHQAVLRMALEMMVAKGFMPLNVPVMTKEQTFIGSGQFPTGRDQVYAIPEDQLFLVGTAEVPVTSLYMDEILEEADLPKRFVAQSLCFRREAGAAGKDTQGLYRIHMFEKVEQVILCKYDLDEAETWHQHIVANSEEVLQKLELPYRVIEVCTGDMGLGKYRMYDIETWMPSRNGYCETHSASNLLDFQARRLNLRYRDKDRKVRHCVTMNNTVIASPRILIALMELYQNADGSVTVPRALRPYMMGRERIVK